MENSDSFYRQIIDSIPIPILVVEEDVRIVDANRAAAALVGKDGNRYIRKRGGEALYCIHSLDAPEGCGAGPSCSKCVIRNSVKSALLGSTVTREVSQMTLMTAEHNQDFELLVTAAPFEFGGRQLVLLILEDVSELRKLQTLLPMCAKCRRIRSDKDYWLNVEKYLSTQHGIMFSHGICPDCMKELYPEVARKSG